MSLFQEMPCYSWNTLCSPLFVSQADQKRKLQPWITKGLLTSIKKKNQIYEKFFSAKNYQNKQTLYEEFTKYHNTISKLTKINKSKHYNTSFFEHKKNLKRHGRELNQLSILPKNQTKLSTVLTLMIRR